MGNGSCRRKSSSGYLKEPKKAAREKKSLLIISNLTNLGSCRPRDNKASSLEKTIMFLLLSLILARNQQVRKVCQEGKVSREGS